MPQQSPFTQSGSLLSSPPPYLRRKTGGEGSILKEGAIQSPDCRMGGAPIFPIFLHVLVPNLRKVNEWEEPVPQEAGDPILLRAQVSCAPVTNRYR